MLLQAATNYKRLPAAPWLHPLHFVTCRMITRSLPCRDGGITYDNMPARVLFMHPSVDLAAANQASCGVSDGVDRDSGITHDDIPLALSRLTGPIEVAALVGGNARVHGQAKWP